MALVQLAYRATVYQRYNGVSNSNESAILTPASGAPHSDQFKVTTLPSLSGYQPYMGIPKGRRSRFDPLQKTLDVGSVSFELLDKRTTAGGSNLSRWVTAFVGDTAGYANMRGLKVYVEESTDGGSTWSPYFVGRISKFALSSRLTFQIDIKEDNYLLERETFTSYQLTSVPSYFNAPQLWPTQITTKFGGIVSSSVPPRATVRTISDGDLSEDVFNYPVAMYRYLNVNSTPRGQEYAVVADYFRNRTIIVESGIWDRLSNILGNLDTFKDQDQGPNGIAVSLTSGSTTGIYEVMGIDIVSGNALGQLWYRSFDTPLSYSLSLFNDADQVQVRVYEIAGNSTSVYGTPPTEDVPYLFNDVNAMTLVKDVLDGKYSLSGAKIPYSSSLTTFANKGFLSNIKMKVDKPIKTTEWLQKYICQPLNIGYRVVPSLSASVPQAQIEFFDMRIPTSIASLPTITSDDVVTAAPGWEFADAINIYEIKTFLDTPISPRDYIVSNDSAEVPFGAVKTWQDTPLRIINVSHSMAEPKIFKIDGHPFHTVLSDPDLTDLTLVESESLARTSNRAKEALYSYNTMFSRAPAYISLECRRVSAVTGCQIGDYRLIENQAIPNPTTHLRGGTRLMQCVERSENGLTITLRFLDVGQNTQQTSITFGSWGTGTGRAAYNSVTGSVTASAQSRVNLHYAPTATSVSTRPDTSSSLWRLGFSKEVAAGSHNVAITGLPSNTRIWLYGQSYPTADTASVLPSSVTYPTPGYVDTKQIPAPTGVTVSPTGSISEDYIYCTWTNTVTWASVEVRVKVSSSAAFTVAVMGPGSSKLLMNPWVSASTFYTASVRYRDNLGGYSEYASQSFTITSYTAPALIAPTITIEAGLL